MIWEKNFSQVMLQFLAELQKDGVEINESKQQLEKERYRFQQLLSSENKEKIKRKLANNG